MSHFRYGPWPLRIDREGADMPADDRAEFLRRREEGETNGSVVIPVWLKQRWWLYEGAAGSPDFPPFVSINLSAGDWREITVWWQDLQAEVWARRAAQNSP